MRSTTIILADLALRHGGVRAAARVAGVPASTIGAALERMEQGLGLDLARRGPGGIGTTVAASRAAPQIARLAGLCRQVHGLAGAGEKAGAGVDVVPARSVSMQGLLRLAEAIDSGSIRRAAMRIGLSQPQLTRQIAQIERSLGAPLVLRRPEGVIATPEGRRIAALIPALEAEWQALGRAAAGVPPAVPSGRRYAMGAIIPMGPDGQIAAMLGRIAAQLPRRHGLRVSIASAIADDLLAGLDSGRFDAVLIDARLEAGGAWQQRALGGAEVSLVGPGLPPDLDDPAALRALLAAFPLVLQSPRSGLRQCAEAFLDAACGPDWRQTATIIEVDSLPVLLHMARDGQAISVLPRPSLRGFSAGASLPLPREFALSYWLTWRDRPKSRRLVAAINDALSP